jgi:hypothetical protein
MPRHNGLSADNIITALINDPPRAVNPCSGFRVATGARMKTDLPA